MKLTKLSYALTATMALAYSAPSFGQNINIDSVNVFGQGCPSGTTTRLVTNTQPTGPINYAQVTFDEFSTQLAQHRRKAETRCRIEMMITVPAGYTLPTLKVKALPSVDLPGRGSAVTIYTTLKSLGLTYRNAIQHRQHVFSLNQPVQASPEVPMEFNSVGDIYDSNCYRERKAKITVDTRMVLRHKGRVNGNSHASINQIELLLPMTPVLGESNVIQCQERPAFNWGWWDQRLF